MSRLRSLTAGLRSQRSGDRAERTLGAIACLTFVAIVLMVVFVIARAAPTFSHEGLSWLGSGGDVDTQIGAMANGSSSFHVRVCARGLVRAFAKFFALIASRCASVR